MGENEIVKLFNAKIKLELENNIRIESYSWNRRRFIREPIRSIAGRILQRHCWKKAMRWRHRSYAAFWSCQV